MSKCDAQGTCPKYPVILTIAGSDSGGGAGIQADLKTMTALGGFGTSVLTALTAQNGQEVRGVHDVPPEFVVQQLETVQDGFPVRAAKTGMLSSVPIINALGKALAGKNYPLVVDPVCISQSGHRLLAHDAIAKVIEIMIPLADLLTPNRPETEELTGISINSEDDVCRATGRLLEMGAKAVLLKGGHFDEYDDRAEIVDWLAVPGQLPKALAHQRVHTPNNHGTGCTLSAAIATFLGFGLPLEEAVLRAKEFLRRALAGAYAPGLGAGPPNFMASIFNKQ